MTKAERIYNATVAKVRKLNKDCDDFGWEHTDVVTIESGNETVICKRTYNDMVKYHNELMANLKVGYKYGTITKAEVEERLEVARIMKNSLKNLKEVYEF